MSSSQTFSSATPGPGEVIVESFKDPLYSITLYRAKRDNQILKALRSPPRIIARIWRGMILGNPSDERETATLRPRVPSKRIPPTPCIRRTEQALRYRTKPGFPDLVRIRNEARVKTTVARVQDGFFPTRIKSTSLLNQLIQPLPDFTLVIQLKSVLSSLSSPERNRWIRLLFFFINYV